MLSVARPRAEYRQYLRQTRRRKERKLLMIMVSSEDLTYVYSLDPPSSMFEVIGTCVDPAITALGTGTVNDRAISSCKSY